jgi:hypothetical protein
VNFDVISILFSFIIYICAQPDDGQLGADIFNDAIGRNAVSLTPDSILSPLIFPQSPNVGIPGNQLGAQESLFNQVKQFVSAECDNLMKFWGDREDAQS